MKFWIEKIFILVCSCGKEFKISFRDETKIKKLYCPFCGKYQDVIHGALKCTKRKLSKMEAAQAVAHSFYLRIIKNSKNRNEERYYFCEICNSYHLTSQKEDKKQNVHS